MAKKAVTSKSAPVPASPSHKAIPTYPLSPTEIEMIVFTRWDGTAFTKSERATPAAITLEGEQLQQFVMGLPFNPDYKPADNRMVEIAPANDADVRWLLDRAHRVQLVSIDGKLPGDLDNEGWRSGKPGVKKDDGIGILVHRPAA